MTKPHNSTYDRICRHARETAVLTSLEELVGWDERTYMPSAAGPYRAEQLSYLAGLIHRRQTDPQLGEWLEQLSSESPQPPEDTVPAANIRELWREYQKQRKIPTRLVEELARATVLGQQAWAQSRKANDYASFAPRLDEIIKLKREQADAVGWEHDRYDALLDDYEPGQTARALTPLLADLRRRLIPLVQKIGESGRQAPIAVLRRQYDVRAQQQFGREVARHIGFDFDRGRLDTTDHPFCAGMGPHDCRITTRFDPQFFPTAFFGILHEAGHGLYDQGLTSEDYGLPSGQFVSLGVHESQSRLWENQVGRSAPFWQAMLPVARRYFPETLADVDGDTFYFAVNHVAPSLIRVEADEATYNLHICIRFELEQELIDDRLTITDLPDAWNQRYQDYLGIRPPRDADGVLQDIHWSAGLFGYFPTYALGNIYAAQLFARARADLDPLDGLLQAGEFGELLRWLREHIHAYGRRFQAPALIERATGESVSVEPLMTHLRDKLGPLYDVADCE